jgi:Ser/Thr protein kinase RdoA (MazF antagonist)
MANYDFSFTFQKIKNANGNRSENFVINTSSGKKLLKRYNPKLNQTTIIHEHSILNYLSSSNFPSPRLISNKLDKTLTFNDNRYYALFDFIEGLYQCRDYILFPNQIRKYLTIAGEMLSLLHKKLINFKPEGCNPDGFKSKSGDRKRNLEWHLSKLEQCRNMTSKADKMREINKKIEIFNRSDYFKKKLIKLDSRLKEADLPKVTIHGDYGFYNILFRKEGPPVVIDFEMARLEWRMVDIVRALYYLDFVGFCRNNVKSNFKKINTFANAYQKNLELTGDEIKLFPDIWEYLNIKGAIVSWHTYCQNGKDSALMGLRKSLNRLDWMKTNKKFLKSSLVKKVESTSQ